MTFEEELLGIKVRLELLRQRKHKWSADMEKCFVDKLEHDMIVLSAKKELGL